MKLRVFSILGCLGLLIGHAHRAMPQTPALSLADAEARTLKNQPRLAAEALRAQALGKRVQQTRSAYFPQLTANLTAVKANGDSEVAAGAVTTSSVSTRVAGGVTLTQLVTDFGRTRDLVRTSRLTAQSASQSTEDVRQQILRDVDQAYFATEAAESVRGTAQAVLALRRTELRQLTAWRKASCDPRSMSSLRRCLSRKLKWQSFRPTATCKRRAHS